MDQETLIKILKYGFGFAGAGLMYASYTMKGMLRLRVMAAAASVLLFFYGMFSVAWPTIILYGLLIPLNLNKARHMRHVVRAIEHMRADTPVAEWLLPHMHERHAPAGTVLWRKGDPASEMVYLEHGELRLVELDERLGPESLLGEIGLFAPDNRRTLTVECVTDCTLHSLSSTQFTMLYYESPKLGYHLVRLMVARLMQDNLRAAAAPSQAQAPALDPPAPAEPGAAAALPPAPSPAA